MIGNDEAIDFCEDCGAGLREDGYCEICSAYTGDNNNG